VDHPIHYRVSSCRVIYIAIHLGTHSHGIP
jgi:Transcriptional regulator of RNA polII, SAGA, subunit